MKIKYKKMEQIFKAIKEKYQIKIDEIVLLRESSDNKVFLLKTNNNQYILRISKRDIKDDVLFETAWLEYLKKSGIPVAKVIKTTSKESFIILDQLTIALFQFVDGQGLKIDKKTKPDLEKVKQAALWLGKIHKITKNKKLVSKRKRNIFTEIDRCLKIKNKIIERTEGGKKFINELEFYQKWAKNNQNSFCLIHNDYRPSNILFIDNKISAILDFDWSCYGPQIKDLALALCEWSFPDGAKKPWFDVFETFLEHYNKNALYQIKSNNYLYHWISFSCLSDTATYLTDLAEKNIFKKTASSYMYQKFLHFQKLIK